MSENDKPNRSFMDDPDIQWKQGKPDYSVVDKLYMEGKTKHHAPGSIENTVSDLMKTFEMEVVHKTQLKDLRTVTPDLKVNINGGPYFTATETTERGGYNVFLSGCPLYDGSAETAESSAKLFKEAFTEGFAWEVLEVIQGPPKLVFTWRHWTRMTGPYKGREPTGEPIELSGCVIADVTEDNRFRTINYYFDPSMMIAKLQGNCPYVH